MPSSSCFYLYTENLSLLVLLPIFAYKKDTCQNLPVSLLYFFKITHLYSIKGIGISSVQTSFPYIMMIWKQWQPADLVKISDFSPFWLCVPAFQQVCLYIYNICFFPLNVNISRLFYPCFCPFFPESAILLSVKKERKKYITGERQICQKLYLSVSFLCCCFPGW